ncbi:MAG: ATP-dependent DNA helicase RecG [Muribaculaceae bacterium]|nr:ATP-dependent DNA helicase RecG [Muribaculaceae bacterium]
MDVKFLKGIGEERAKVLARELDVHSVEDLLYCFPTRYLDRSKVYLISELVDTGTQMQVRGRFLRFAEEGEGRRKRLVALFSDGTRTMEVVWFTNAGYFRRTYEASSSEYILFGRPTFYRGGWQMAHPEIEVYDPSRPPMGNVGVYPLTDTLRRKGFSSKFFRTAVERIFELDLFKNLPETLPKELLKAYGLMPLKETLRHLHLPSDPRALQKARERMKFEELYYLELNILRFARERREKAAGYRLNRVGEKFNRFFHDVLPFRLTEAQKRVVREIRDDLLSGRQMNRLLQGDVGSGKTMVAFLTLLLAVDNGCQGALMAPTEILASQHFDTLSAWGKAVGVNVRLLTGNTRKKEREEIHRMLLDGSLHILVGTHALLEEVVRFHKLGVAVIDEQHRFGVAQRARLWSKGSAEALPHVLVMTATPIPRTLAMTVYGDLEVSVIDELPPGRKPVDTRLFYEEDRNLVYRLVMNQIRAGRQAYIVYPLIKENDKLELKSLEAGVERLRGIFRDIPLCYVHGRMKPDEKDRQMQLFVSGEARILVATTVIEVGVNVPNATVMVIENAERFGLSQLHQLRGRVGRGADMSYCILMSKEKGSRETKKRLGIMTETTDGFLISEADMKLRGPGDLEGTMQSGLAFNLKIANLTQDGQILTLARKAAQDTLDAFPVIYSSDMTASSWSIPPQPGSEALSIILRELHRRFAKSVDWSRIS